MELLNSLKGYKKQYLINDILSGLLVAIIALPLSIALGIQSVPQSAGNGIQMGIITAIVAGFFVSAIGGSRFQIGGPTAAFVVIIFGYISNPQIGIIGLQIATIFAGLLLIVLGLLKGGNLVKYIPYPIVVGFTTGIGITLLFGQIKDLCGFEKGGAEFIEKIIGYIESLSSFNLLTFVLGIGTFIAIKVIPLINKKLPSAFISIVLFTIVNLLIKGEELGVATIYSTYGNISASFSFINFENIFNVNFLSLIAPIVVIAFLGALESLLSATVADGMTKLKSNFNQELIGQGVANVASSFLGGLPATGAIARTSANVESGAKSSLAGVFHAVFLLIMYFLLMGVVKFIPLCTLAAVLINVSINICNPKLFIKMTKVGLRDLVVLLSTMLLTVFFDLTYGVIGGLALAFILNIQNIVKPFKIQTIDGVIKISGPLYFLTINKLISHVNKEVDNLETLVLDFDEVNRIDATSIEKIAKLFNLIIANNKSIEFINCNDKVKNKLDKHLAFMS